MDLHEISPRRYLGTMAWAIIACIVIVAIVSGLARATLNLSAALTDKPDLAVYLLLPEEDIRSIELLRETETQRDYLAETKDGPKLVILRKGEMEWYVAEMEALHGQGEQPFNRLGGAGSW